MELRPLLSYVFHMLEEAGWVGYIVFVLVFTAWVCAALPTVPVELVAGFLYGPIRGPISGLFCKTAGSCAAFLIARLLGRRWGWRVPAALEPQLAALHRRPLAAMVGIRIAPLPLGLKNYGLALSNVSLMPYTIASVIVNGPFSVLWGLLGASCQSLTEAVYFNTSQVSPLSSMAALLLRREALCALALGAVGWLLFRTGRCGDRSATDSSVLCSEAEGEARQEAAEAEGQAVEAVQNAPTLPGATEPEVVEVPERTSKLDQAHTTEQIRSIREEFWEDKALVCQVSDWALQQLSAVRKITAVLC